MSATLCSSPFSATSGDRRHPPLACRRIMRLTSILLGLALFAAVPAHAQGLTVRLGETWIFVLSKGQPAKARKVDAATSARRGEIKVSVRSMLGTTMTINGNIAK